VPRSSPLLLCSPPARRTLADRLLRRLRGGSVKPRVSTPTKPASNPFPAPWLGNTSGTIATIPLTAAVSSSGFPPGPLPVVTAIPRTRPAPDSWLWPTAPTFATDDPGVSGQPPDCAA
jgi:hypothetical protein